MTDRNRLGEAVSRAISATAGAKSLDEARSAWYRHPVRTGLAGSVAFAVWDSFAYELSTILLGLCGRSDFPTTRQQQLALTYMFTEWVSGTESKEEQDMVLDILTLLAQAKEGCPATLNQQQIESLGSFLSFEAPQGGESEMLLCAEFPDTLSLVPNFQRKSDEVIAQNQTAANPWELIREQGELISALRQKCARLERLPQG